MKQFFGRMSARKSIVAAVLAGSIMFATISTAGPVMQLKRATPTTMNPQDAQSVVACSYEAILNRTPDAGGAAYWQQQYVESGYNAQWLAAHMQSSSEARALNLPAKAYVSNLYTQCLKRTPNADEVAYWTTMLTTDKISRAALFQHFVYVADKSDVKPAATTEVACAQFTRGGSVAPLCRAGTAGSSGDVVTTTVAGSNIVVNKAWAKNITDLRAAAAAAGYDLQATPSSSPYPTAGSFRSAEAQQWMRNHGYPAAKGVSNHQWGLAVDFRCNGKPLAATSCLKWMKYNAGTYGVYNKIMSSEPWHWSSTGY